MNMEILCVGGVAALALLVIGAWLILRENLTAEAWASKSFIQLVGIALVGLWFYTTTPRRVIGVLLIIVLLFLALGGAIQLILGFIDWVDSFWKSP